MEKLEKLTKAMKEYKPKNIVHDLFLDYIESYKRMRKPTCEDDRKFRDTYFKYSDYMNKLSGSQR